MVIYSFKNVVYLEDCVEKLATLHFKTKMLILQAYVMANVDV